MHYPNIELSFNEHGSSDAIARLIFAHEGSLKAAIEFFVTAIDETVPLLTPLPPPPPVPKGIVKMNLDWLQHCIILLQKFCVPTFKHFLPLSKDTEFITLEV